MDEPDPVLAAHAATAEGLLRCFVRETGVPVPERGLLRLHLPATGLELEVPVRYASPTGWHRLGPPKLAGGAPADLAIVAAALVREGVARLNLPPHAGVDAVARVLDSAGRVAAHIAAHRSSPTPPGTPPFLAAEQALVLGHPFHPTPKSREGASDAELAAYSPELGGRFPLHWFAAHRSVLASDCALDCDAEHLIRPLAGDLEGEFVPVPAHPWQARDIRGRPEVAELLNAGLLRDLGPAGPAWYPTSSVRTVYRPDREVMLKLSVGLRITNSRRINLRSELRLGVAVARLLAAGLSDELRRAHPAFGILRDFAWIAVDTPGSGPEGGLDTAIRENPFGRADRVVCVSALVAERPGRMRTEPSLLAELVRTLALRTSRPAADVAAEWYDRYLAVVAVPLLWLYTTHGLALEAHQQNTLVRLDDAGWPVAGWYRDSQGYYVAASHAEAMRELLPGFDGGVPVVFDDSLVDERVGYYLGVNNLLGLVGAIGSQGLADETVLLRRLRTVLTRFASSPGAGGKAPPVVTALLDSPTLCCKGNYLTCVDGRDELVGEVATQSVYVHIPNPLAEVRS